MKKQIVKTFAMLSLMLAAGMFQAVYAQTVRSVVVSIPFEFVAGKDRLPAGRYTISRVSISSDKALMIRSLDGAETATVITQSVNTEQASGVAKLTFKKYGDRYFLSDIWAPGAASVRQISPSKEEKRLSRGPSQRIAAGGAQAGEGPEVETVVVTGSLR